MDIPRAEAWSSLCLVFHKGYSTLDNARRGSPKPEDTGFRYSSGISQSYSQLPRKPAGVVLAAVTDLPRWVFFGRRPSSVGIPRTPTFLGGYSLAGGLFLLCARSSTTGIPRRPVFLKGYSSAGGLVLFLSGLPQRGFHTLIMRDGAPQRQNI